MRETATLDDFFLARKERGMLAFFVWSGEVDKFQGWNWRGLDEVWFPFVRERECWSICFLNVFINARLVTVGS